MPPLCSDARYFISVGYEVPPVPVYYPEVTHILGHRVDRSLVEIPLAVDLVDVFRRAEDRAGHVEDIVAKRPKAEWLQSGIRHDAVAQRLAEGGIKVVQDQCSDDSSSLPAVSA